MLVVSMGSVVLARWDSKPKNTNNVQISSAWTGSEIPGISILELVSTDWMIYENQWGTLDVLFDVSLISWDGPQFKIDDTGYLEDENWEYTPNIIKQGKLVIPFDDLVMASELNGGIALILVDFGDEQYVGLLDGYTSNDSEQSSNNMALSGLIMLKNQNNDTLIFNIGSISLTWDSDITNPENMDFWAGFGSLIRNQESKLSALELLVSAIETQLESVKQWLFFWNYQEDNVCTAIENGCFGPCIDMCSEASTGCLNDNTKWDCEMQNDGCYDKIGTSCEQGEICNLGMCVQETSGKVIFRTNAVDGGYQSGTWIAVDTDNDDLLEGYDYTGSSGILSTCKGTPIATTPEGFSVNLYYDHVIVCKPSGAKFSYKKYYDSSTDAETSSAPTEPYASNNQEVYGNGGSGGGGGGGPATVNVSIPLVPGII